MAELLTLPEKKPRPAPGERQAVMLVARDFLPRIIRTGMPLPADVIDVRPTRDGDFALVLAGVGFPSDRVMAVFRRNDPLDGWDDGVRFVRWEPCL